MYLPYPNRPKFMKESPKKRVSGESQVLLLILGPEKKEEKEEFGMLGKASDDQLRI
jgi:hypothetical protein